MKGKKGVKGSGAEHLAAKEDKAKNSLRDGAKSMCNDSAPAHPGNSKQPWSAHRIEPCTQQHL